MYESRQQMTGRKNTINADAKKVKLIYNLKLFSYKFEQKFVMQ